MDFFSLINLRQSTRKFSSKPVEKEKIVQCVDAARLAPSACNSQPWTYIIVDEPELCKKVRFEAYRGVLKFNKFAAAAPVMVVVVIEPVKFTSRFGWVLKDREFPLIDLGLTASHFCLQAAELGLGTCMLGWFNEKEVKKLLNIPASKRLGLMIAMGYPPDDYKLRQKIRKPLMQVIRFNAYGGQE